MNISLRVFLVVLLLTAYAALHGFADEPKSPPVRQVTVTGTAIIKVLEKQEVNPADLAKAKDTFRDEILADRRNRFFSAYMAKAKQKMKIEVNREALQRVIS